ncbi:GID complex subunit containing RING finger motif [Borealophlyctis nickersoniae]|nr:GID complex subunit containing RING finger motif [Borealophlyctis nickersoniae]
MSTLTTNVEGLMETGSGLPPAEACKTLDGMVDRLRNLKRKLSDIKAEETYYVQRTKARLDHLAELTSIESSDSAAYARWSKTRVDRILADYMLRKGYTQTAEKLAKESDIEALVDIELFARSRRVEDALQRHSCQECLQWCADNKSSLRKNNSTLEFNLRLQEYIELVRARKLKEAIDYARKHLTSWSDTHMKEIQQAMGLLAFSPDTSCESYRALYDSSRWAALITQFRTDNYSINSLTSQPLLRMTLQAGLSALKTPMCYQPENRNLNCPVCASDTFGVLAEKLPNAHHVNSCLVCRASGEMMNEDNPPLVLPNGYVYSAQALNEMAAKNNGTVKCARTGALYHISQTRKAYIS